MTTQIVAGMLHGMSNALNDPKRLRQLQIRRILDSPREEAFDRLTRLAAQALHAPVTLLTFVDDRRQWFKSSYGLAEPWSSRRETPLSHSFCQLVVANRQPLVVTDARQDPLVQENLAIPDMGVEAYLGAPLIDSDDSALGSFAVIDDHPRRWTARETRMVEDFASIAMVEVQMRTEIAQRAEAEEALRQAQRLEAIGRLAGGIAHDFNNMLLIIQGYASLLAEETAESDPRSEHVREIRKAAQRAGALTRQLLAFSRKQTLQPQNVNVNALLTELEPMLRRTLGEKIRLTLRLDPALECVCADPGQLEQVVMNLVLNARDAVQSSGEIRLCTQNRTAGELLPPEGVRLESREWIELRVEDTGVGMSAEALQHIFEPFYTTKGMGKGTGLGLATVYGVVRQSNGHVWAESLPNHGSVFRVLLPAAAAAPAAAPEARAVAAAPAAPCAQRQTLLVVEDEDAVRKLLVTMLERYGYRIIAAESGEAALRLSDEDLQQVDLAILDVVMEGVNGRALYERLAARRPHLKVLYISGYTDDEVLKQGVERRDVQMLDKPVTADQLLEKVTEVIGG